MDAQKYLTQIKKIDTLIKNKNVEVIQAGKLGIDTSYIRNGIKQLEKDRRDIIENIQKLNEAEYDVLHKRYVQGESFYEIANDRGISYSNATTIHGRALQNLSRIINV